jgi:hypothetical protein
VDFDDQTPALDVENSIAEIDQQIKLNYPQVKRVFISAKAWCALSARHKLGDNSA